MEKLDGLDIPDLRKAAVEMQKRKKLSRKDKQVFLELVRQQEKERLMTAIRLGLAQERMEHFM